MNETTEANKNEVRRAIACFNDPGHREGYLQMYGPACRVHGLPPGLPDTYDGLAVFYRALWAAFPDVTIDVEALFGEGDSVAVRFKATGVHAHDFFELKADGNHATFYVILHLVFGNSRVIERWGQLTMVEV